MAWRQTNGVWQECYVTDQIIGDREVDKIKDGYAHISGTSDLWLPPKSPVVEPKKEWVPVVDEWIIGVDKCIPQRAEKVTKVTDYGVCSNSLYHATAFCHVRKATQAEIAKAMGAQSYNGISFPENAPATKAIKEPASSIEVPGRKWQSGSMFMSKYNGSIYTIDVRDQEGEYRVYNSEDGVPDEWYTATEIDELYSTNAWIPYNPQPMSVIQIGAKVRILPASGCKDVGKCGIIRSQGRTATRLWFIDLEDGGSLCAFDGTGNERKQFEVITNNKQSSQTTQKTNNNGNSNKEISKDSNISYTGISICEWPQEEIISSGTYRKGTSLSVHAEPDRISRGQRATGTSLSCR